MRFTVWDNDRVYFSIWGHQYVLTISEARELIQGLSAVVSRIEPQPNTGLQATGISEASEREDTTPRLKP